MHDLDRRRFLQGAAATAAGLALAPLASWAGPTSDWEATLVALSRDADGRPHVAHAALVTGRHVTGSLALSSREIEDLRRASRAGDFTAMQAGGLWAGQQRYVFVDAREGGQVCHGVRPGGFVTVRLAGDRAIVATATAGMAHGRAVEAVHQLMQRFTDRA